MTSRVVFPKGFVWGTATSSYQIEGAAREDGRGESIWDRYAKTASKIKDGSSGDVACDHYHRWREDVALMASLGHRAYRFSIAWPRVLPSGRGAENTRGLDFYSRLVDALLAARITPFATLFHWDLPQALQDGGGWPERETAEAFVEYADRVTRRLGDRVKHWITHNEPWCSSYVAHQIGAHAPGVRDWRAAAAASHHILLSHGLALDVVRRNSPGAEVGITLNLSPSIPASDSAADHEAARRHDGYMNRWFLDPVYRAQYPADVVADYAESGRLPTDWSSIVKAGDLRAIAGHTDFIGINYYNRYVARSELVPEHANAPRKVFLAPESEKTDIGWEVYPPGMFEVLTRVHLEYRPAKIYVTENGVSYLDAPDKNKRVADVRRIRFMRDHIAQIERAIAAGAPVAGYFAWSLMDNFEWDHGYTQRFGLCWVDYATQERIPKDSARWYKNVIEENAVTVDSP
ncbi:MAG TPA: GH1 family beta-glucosidase [Polyangiaceae bacterium]|nr:GH1 family beta-glucosidase [Polyangiaceae bacterium]